MKTTIQRLWNAVGLPCRECGGRGYVVDSDVAAFIDRNGLAQFQAATALMTNEIQYGGLGSLPVSAWEDLGLTEEAAMDFATEVGNCHVLHSCRSCHGQPNHTGALDAAMAVLNKHLWERQRAREEWEDRCSEDCG